MGFDERGYFMVWEAEDDVLSQSLKSLKKTISPGLFYRRLVFTSFGSWLLFWARLCGKRVSLCSSHPWTLDGLMIHTLVFFGWHLSAH